MSRYEDDDDEDLRPQRSTDGRGRNSRDDDDEMSPTVKGRLRTIVERIERLEEDKAGVMADIREVYAEAKGDGFDVKILRKVVARRKKEPAKVEEEETIMDLYIVALL